MISQNTNSVKRFGIYIFSLIIVVISAGSIAQEDFEFNPTFAVDRNTESFIHVRNLFLQEIPGTNITISTFPGSEVSIFHNHQYRNALTINKANGFTILVNPGTGVSVNSNFNYSTVYLNINNRSKPIELRSATDLVSLGLADLDDIVTLRNNISSITAGVRFNQVTFAGPGLGFNTFQGSLHTLMVSDTRNYQINYTPASTAVFFATGGIINYAANKVTIYAQVPVNDNRVFKDKIDYIGRYVFDIAAIYTENTTAVTISQVETDFPQIFGIRYFDGIDTGITLNFDTDGSNKNAVNVAVVNNDQFELRGTGTTYPMRRVIWVKPNAWVTDGPTVKITVQAGAIAANGSVAHTRATIDLSNLNSYTGPFSPPRVLIKDGVAHIPEAVYPYAESVTDYNIFVADEQDVGLRILALGGQQDIGFAGSGNLRVLKHNANSTVYNYESLNQAERQFPLEFLVTRDDGSSGVVYNTITVSIYNVNDPLTLNTAVTSDLIETLTIDISNRNVITWAYTIPSNLFGDEENHTISIGVKASISASFNTQLNSFVVEPSALTNTTGLFTIDLVATETGISNPSSVSYSFQLTVNHAPTMHIENSFITIAERSAAITSKTSLSGNRFRFIIGDKENDAFRIHTVDHPIFGLEEVTQGSVSPRRLYIKATSTLDFDVARVGDRLFTVTVQAFDSAKTSRRNIYEFTISLTNIDEAPVPGPGFPSGDIYVNSHLDFEYIIPNDFYVDPEGNEITYTSGEVASKIAWEAASLRFHYTAAQINDTDDRFSAPVTIVANGKQTIANINFTVHNIQPPSANKLADLAITITENVLTQETTDTGITIEVTAPTDAKVDLGRFGISAPDKFSLSLAVTTGSTTSLRFGVYLKESVSFDYEALTNGQFNLSITINTVPGSRITHVEQFNVVNVNDNPPIIAVSGLQVTINENHTFASDTDTGYVVSMTDADGGQLGQVYTRYLLGSARLFKLSDDNKLQVAQNARFNYERTPYVPLTLSFSDGVNSSTVSVLITISDVNEPPRENPSFHGSTVIAAITNDFSYIIPEDAVNDADENDTITYTVPTLPSGFVYDASMRRIYANAASVLIAGQHVVNIQATDSANNQIQTRINLHLVPGPRIMQRSAQSRTVTENVVFADAAIGSRSLGYSFSFSHASGVAAMSVSHPKFELANVASFVVLAVRHNEYLDYEEGINGVIPVTVFATSNNGVTSNRVVNVAVVDVDEDPSLTKSGEQIVIVEDRTFQTATNTGYTYRGSDPEGIARIAISGDSDKFQLPINGGNLQIKATTIFDYEEKSTYTLVVSATDTTNNSVYDTLTISVSNDYDALSRNNNRSGTIMLASGETVNINLLSLINADANTNNISVSIVSGATTWLNVTNTMLQGIAPHVTETTQASIALMITQSLANRNNSNVSLNINFQINPRNLNSMNEVIVPRILDAIASAGIGAVADRITGLAQGENINGLSDELLAVIKNNRDKINNREDINIYEIFNGREIALGFHDGDLTNTNFGLWLRFDYNQLKSAPIDEVSYDGSLSGLSAGADYRFVDGGILGLAYSNYKGEIDYTNMQTNTAVKGHYEVGVDLVQPYFSGDLGDLDYWVSFGVGTGDIDIIEIGTTAVNEYDVDLYLGAVGFDAKIFAFTDDTSLEFFGDIQQGNIVLKPESPNFDETKMTNRNIRSGFNLAQKTEFDSGAFRSKVGLAAVNQATDAKLDRSVWGYEVFGEVGYLLHAVPLRMNADVSYLTINTTEQEQISGGVLINFRNASSRLGAFMELSPAYRSSSDNELFDLNYNANNVEDILGAPRILFSSKVGYGFGAIGGIITPYGNYLIDSDKEDYSLGVRYVSSDVLSLGLGFNRSSKDEDDTKLEIQYKIIN